MKERLKELIAEYELSVQNLGYDQLTDDAMNHQKYLGMVASLERAILDLKRIVGQ